MAKNAIYGGRDPRDVPMYRLVEAARLLRVPASTLRSWTKGQDYKVQGERRRFRPPIPLDDGQAHLTFYNLVEAFVLSSMRRDFHVELPVVRRAMDFVREKMGVQRPLLTKDFFAQRGSLLVEEWGPSRGPLLIVLDENIASEALRDALAPPIICHISRDGEVTVKVGIRRGGIKRR